MQVTAVPQRATPKQVAEGLFTLLAYFLKESSHDMFRTVGELDLSLTQVKLLHILDAADEARSVKELSESVGLSLPAASRAVDGLHKRGLVERHEHSSDRRMKAVQPSPAGRRVIRKLNEARLSVMEKFAASLSDTERERLTAALAPLLSREDVAVARGLMRRGS